MSSPRWGLRAARPAELTDRPRPRREPRRESSRVTATPGRHARTPAEHGGRSDSEIGLTCAIIKAKVETIAKVGIGKAMHAVGDLLSRGFQKARAAGWAQVYSGFSPQEIAVAVSLVGSPLRSRDRTGGIEQLIPRHQHETSTPSLSARYGLGEFPFHSDAAHWPSPPRWVVMWCEVDETRRPTNLHYWSPLVERACKDTAANFLVRNGRRSFFVDVRKEARLDAGCMIPQNHAAHRMIELSSLANAPEPIAIMWEAGMVLILDNKRMLHARSDNLSEQVGRVGRRLLWRALLDEVHV
jgi:hypothetical protein